MKEDDNLTLRNASEVDIEKKADVNLTEEDKFLVEFKENDPHNPKNWSVSRKWYTTVLTSVFILSSTIASSLPSTIIANMMIEFQTTQTIAICTITVFLLGYGECDILRQSRTNMCSSFRTFVLWTRFRSVWS